MASPAVERMKEALFTGLDYMAMPGDYTRGLIANTVNKVKGGPLLKDRLTGREMLEGMNWVGSDQEGLDVGDVLGFGADLVVDPLNVVLGGLGAVAGVGRGAIKGAKAVAGLARGGKAAETLAGAKAALGAIPGAVARQGKGMAYALGAPVGGAYLMANNEEGSDLKDLVGMGLMASPLMLPLAMAAGRKIGKKAIPLPEFTSTKSVQDEAGIWVKKTEPVDMLSSDELKEALSVWQTAGTTRPRHAEKFLHDALVARGDRAASHEERIAAATNILREFPATHYWSKRAAKLQEAREALAADDAKDAMQSAPAIGEHGVIPISRPEIDFLEQLGIRDATKWQEIKRMLAGADARTPEAQAVVERFLPGKAAQVNKIWHHGSKVDPTDPLVRAEIQQELQTDYIEAANTLDSIKEARKELGDSVDAANLWLRRQPWGADASWKKGGWSDLEKWYKDTLQDILTSDRATAIGWNPE